MPGDARDNRGLADLNGKPDIYFTGGVHWYSHCRFVDVQRPAAYGLYWAMTAWARDNLTDGLVPRSVVTSVLAPAVKADAIKDPNELVRVGLLKEGQGGFHLHRFLGWNDSAETVQRRKDAASNAARKRWASEPHANGHSPAHTGAHATSTVTSTSAGETT